MVTGKARPDKANSELFTFAEEMVTAPFEADRVSCELAEAPTVTLPKLRLEGEAPRVAPLTATPVPQTFITSLGSRASLRSVMVPVVFPTTRGSKITGN